MKCSKCGDTLTIEETKFKKFLYCLTCYETFNSVGYEPDCCQNPSLIKVRHKISNGSYNIRDQCKNCGKINTKSYSHKSYDINGLPESDISRNAIRLEIIDENYQTKRKWFSEHKEKNFSINKIHPDYPAYLETEEWKTKRELVFKRDNYKCQSCLKNRADQVHHLNYKNIFNEPLFELISICTECHKIITDREKGVKIEKKIVH